VANHADVVVMDLNARNHTTVAYLLSPDGQLRKAVSAKAGEEAKPLSAADAQAGLAREKKYWSARPKAAQPAAPAAPH
jgi:cytochrome oxidase Cu insertion factor (SCO1/SenC/PrrC family)